MSEELLRTEDLHDHSGEEHTSFSPLTSVYSEKTFSSPVVSRITPTIQAAQDMLARVAEVTSSPIIHAVPYKASSIEAQTNTGTSSTSLERIGSFPSARVEDELEEAQRIKNKDALQDVALKKITLVLLFLFLAFETIAVFIFAFFQGTHSFGFQLEEWSFNLLLTATILQVTYMIQVAVKYLFNDRVL